MKKSEINRQEKEKRILEAAREAFHTCGFIGANMDRIADAAGVTKQTVYRYFTTKENLFLQTIEVQRKASRDCFLEALDIEDTRKALLTFTRGYTRKHLSKEHLATIRLLVVEGPEIPEVTKAFYATGAEKTRARFSAFLKERFPDRDTEFAASAFFGILLAPRMQILTGLHQLPSLNEIDQLTDNAVNFLLKALS